MERIAHLSLQTSQPPEVRRARLGGLRLLLAKDTAFGDVSPVRPDEGPGFTIALPDALDEDEAAARIHGAAFSLSIHADELDILFAVADPVPPASCDAVLRLSVAGPLDIDERNDAYDRLKAIGGRAGWPFIGGHMQASGVYADLQLPLGATPRELGAIIVTLVEATAAQQADIDQITVQVFAGSVSRRDTLYARLRIAPRDGQGPGWAELRTQLLTPLAISGWEEAGRSAGCRQDMMVILRVPHTDPLQAGRELAAAIASTAEPPRVAAALLSEAEALRELGGCHAAPCLAAPGPHNGDLDVDRIEPGVQEALLNLIADGEDWRHQRHYGTGPVRTPAGPVEPTDGWYSEDGDGAMLDDRRYGFIRNAAGTATIIEWATGNLVLLSPAALAGLAHLLAPGA
ncbi:MAG: hypothetical protein WCI67_18070 [Chloroflexales bacterium]